MRATLRPPTLRAAIGLILCAGSKPQVRWVDARRVVARMANMQTWGNRPLVYEVGQAMSREVLLFESHAAITGIRNAAGPVPAFRLVAGVAPFIESVNKFLLHLRRLVLATKGIV